jgi:Zn-dependent metalloprotease
MALLKFRLTTALLLLVLVMNLLASAAFADAPDQKFSTGSAAEIALAETLARTYLAQALEGKGIAAEDLMSKRVFVDDLAMAHAHVQQTVGGVPVHGGEAVVHINRDGSLSNVTDHLVTDIKVNTTPALKADQAVDAAVFAYGCKGCLTAAPEASLWVLRHAGSDRLVYRVQLRREDGSHETAAPLYFIDAHSGELVWSFDNLEHPVSHEDAASTAGEKVIDTDAERNDGLESVTAELGSGKNAAFAPNVTTTGSGVSLYSGTVSVQTSKTTTYYLEDTIRKMGTFDSRSSTMSVYRFTDTDNVWNSSTQMAGVDAHYGSAKVYDYFKNVHGRNGIDGNGGPAGYASADGNVGLMSSKVHYGRKYNNAFWNGTLMTYGDGDGVTFKPLVTIDIAGHEMTHGITERTSNLVYANESGALNESASDIFGAMVERYTRGQSTNTWLIGEEAYTPATAGDALRSMANPQAAGDPDHYSVRYTGTEDNGGVHINSGIPNHAFYLLANGGTHRLGGSMTGIGADAAAKIWYRALTVYMTSSTNFAQGRAATLQAAADLYGAGSTNYNAVATAWSLVGVN